MLKITDVENTDGISKALVQLVRQHIGPVAAFRHSIHVDRIPKTRSGKTPRNSLQAMLNKKEFNVSYRFTLLLNKIVY